jgi:hypothetical protein
VRKEMEIQDAKLKEKIEKRKEKTLFSKSLSNLMMEN